MRALTRVTSELEQWRDRPDDAFLLGRRAEEIRAGLGFAMESEDPNTVFWIEREKCGTGGGGRSKFRSGRQHVALQATPIDVSQILREYLFARLDTAVLTSATLAVGGEFDYVKNRLGIDNARELVVPSHFDYASQAILYVPPDLPDPRDPAFASNAAICIRRLLEISRGRAFCLFTSYAQMHDIHDRLLGELEFPLLHPGLGAEKRAAGGIPLDAQRGALRDRVVLAGRGRAGRAVELRHHRPPALRGAERSGGRRAHQGHRPRRRQRLLRLPGAGGGDYAEAGIRPPHPLAARPRPAGTAR